MALLDWIAPDHDLRLEGAGVRLRPHRAGDFEEWARLREILIWFNANLPSPNSFSATRAVFWFKSTSRKSISRI